MTATTIKKILAGKFEAEGTGFRFNDISATKTTMDMSTTWNEEKDDFNIEKVDAYKIVIKGYEHIEFFLTTDIDDYFGNEVWIYRRDFGESGNIVVSTYGKASGFDKLIEEALISLGYYIANRF